MEVSGGEVAEQVIHRGVGSRCGGAAHHRPGGRSAGGDPRSGGQKPAGAGHHADQADGGRPHRLPGGERGAGAPLYPEIHSLS